MRLFNRNRTTATADPAVASKPASRSHRRSHGGGFGGRPSFGQWLRETALDILTMFIMGAIGLGVIPLPCLS